MASTFLPSPVVLAGEHVRLEPLGQQHVDGLLDAMRVDRSTYTYTWVPADADEMRRYVEVALEEQARAWSLPFATVSVRSGAVIGSTRFLDLQYWQPSPLPARTDGVPSVAEIGSTWLSATAQRTAINTEAKLLMFTHAFEVWQTLRVTLKTDARNARSRAAIERVGGVYTGVLRAHMPAYDGGVRDTAYFSIVAGEWPHVRERLVRKLERVNTG